MGAAVYASEYECRFTDALDTVFSHTDVMKALDPTVKPLEGGW